MSLSKMSLGFAVIVLNYLSDPNKRGEVMSQIKPQHLLQLIKSRRTVRQFDVKRKVRTASLKRILEAGTWAPYAPYSPMPWKFIALKGQKRKMAISHLTQDDSIKHYMAETYKNEPWPATAEENVRLSWQVFAREFVNNLGNAPVLVIGLTRQDEYERVQKYNDESAWTAVQNMLLQAEAEGLSAGIVTFHSEKIEKELIESLGFSVEKWFIAFLLNIGYANGNPTPAPRKKNLFEIWE